MTEKIDAEMFPKINIRLFIYTDKNSAEITEVSHENCI